LIDGEDLAAELRAYAESASAAAQGEDGLGLEALEERLEVIERLVRKHGGSVAGVLEHAELARSRCQQLDGAQAACADIEGQLADASDELQRHLAGLHDARAAAAPVLAEDVRRQLAALGMGEAAFDVVLSQRDPGPSGEDSVEFVIAPNPGVPGGPVREIASGGELSRIMLAIMSAAHGSARLEGTTLVFDEVDAGVGGHTARAVGERLRDLAGSRQVLCITHLPQIASLAQRHFAIAKDTSVEPTRATVTELPEPEVIAELVRMLGAGRDDAGARSHARDLRRAA